MANDLSMGMSAMITPEYLLSNAEKYANEPALSWKDDSANWVTMTWSEIERATMEVARSLVSIGFEAGDKLSIYSYNRLEWYMAYSAANMAGGAAVGVYHTCSPEEVEWVVGNSESMVVFVGTNPMDGGDASKMCNHRLEAAMGNLGKVEAVVSMMGMDAIDHNTAMTWVDFISKAA